ncbi:MAG: hypothetical protein NZT92_07405 [Abditibacteriales bacterium]|nr:hypothetical protein [Abditibacteriales bacterium]MDW8364771.1 hypothetical protein [Abditibacteriales bacterium]
MPASDVYLLRRVYGTTIWLGGLLTVGLAFTVESHILLSFMAGLVMELGLLMSQDYVVSKLFSPSHAEQDVRVFVPIGVRYGLTIVLLYALTHHRLLNPLAFMGGFLLVHAVIVGKMLEHYLRRRYKSPRTPHSLRGG